jgi:hypothetical protein
MSRHPGQALFLRRGGTSRTRQVIADEVTAFQKKCLGNMSEVSALPTTVGGWR